MMKTFKKGFTLIELLVTIGVLAVVAAGVLAAIDPTDKLKAANDGRVQADMGQVATALNTYAASNDGNFPVAANWGALGTAIVTEMGPMPSAPTALYTYTGVTTATTALIYSPVLSKKYTGTLNSKCVLGSATPYAWWYWNRNGTANATGVACGLCTAGAATPPAIGASTCSF